MDEQSEYVIYYKISVNDKHYEGNFATSANGNFYGAAFLRGIKEHAAQGHDGKPENVIICGVLSYD
jgi:hypothetical protein